MSSAVADGLPTEGFVRLATILGSEGKPGVFPVSRSTFYKLIREGRAPAPVRLGERVSAWRVEDIRQFLEKVAA